MIYVICTEKKISKNFYLAKQWHQIIIYLSFSLSEYILHTVICRHQFCFIVRNFFVNFCSQHIFEYLFDDMKADFYFRFFYRLNLIFHIQTYKTYLLEQIFLYCRIKHLFMIQLITAEIKLLNAPDSKFIRNHNRIRRIYPKTTKIFAIFITKFIASKT